MKFDFKYLMLANSAQAFDEISLVVKAFDPYASDDKTDSVEAIIEIIDKWREINTQLVELELEHNKDAT